MKTPEPSRNVSSSEHADADGGGGMTFVFHGGSGGEDDEEAERRPKKKRRPHAPTYFGPPVELSLSGVAKVEIGRLADQGDFGKIGPVLPPDGISDPLSKGLADASRLESEAEAAGPAEAEETPPEGPRESSSGGLLKMLV